MKTELTKEQSQHLIELGVPEYNASGSTYTLEPDYAFSYARDFRYFSIIDLLEILPKEIKVSGFKLPLIIEFDIDNANAYYYTYRGYNSNAEELIDALYELTVWCIENGYLKFERI